MPHTGSILHGRYAVVSCHVERPLDDEVWRRFSELQRRRPGGFAIAALMRPPANGEDEAVWLERAREAEQLGPFGLHTHWTAPEHARPTGGDPAALVREQGEWLRSVGLDAQLFCGGGWYLDADVAHAGADLGYARWTATSFPPTDAACGSSRRLTRSACSFAASSAAPSGGRSCTRTSTTPTCSTDGAHSR